MIAVTIALGASFATAMLNIMLYVGDKVNQELKAYGANITVVPKENSVLNDLYSLDGQEETAVAHLNEDDLGKIKTIFWGFNILDFTPFVKTTVTLDTGDSVKLTGTWFNHHLALNTGEELDAGIHSLRSWWDIKNGQWLDEQNADSDDNSAMIGTVLADRLGVSTGDTIRVKKADGEKTLSIVGVYDSGGDEDEQIFTALPIAQELGNSRKKIDSIEVSALTTPDNELAKKDVSSICYQIQEAIPDSVASPVRQVAESEGNILDKTQLLMILITVLSLFGSALGISNLVTASVMERSNEIGLLKAIGARDYRISGIVLTEITVTAIVGGVAGYFMGYGFAQIIGQTVFNSSIEMKPMVIPIVAVLIVIVTLAGSIPAIRMLLRLRPAEVLHGR